MKAVITFGWGSEMVIDADKAVRVLELLQGAEQYKEKWHNETSSATFHVFAKDKQEPMTIKILPDALYKMAKLAGKPEEK